MEKVFEIRIVVFEMFKFKYFIVKRYKVSYLKVR